MNLKYKIPNAKQMFINHYNQVVTDNLISLFKMRKQKDKDLQIGASNGRVMMSPGAYVSTSILKITLHNLIRTVLPFQIIIINIYFYKLLK